MSLIKPGPVTTDEPTARVWLVVEEIEAGSYADASTYCPLSAHTTEKGADDARDAWRACHERGRRLVPRVRVQRHHRGGSPLMRQEPEPLTWEELFSRPVPR
jgi:hypothetical protein